MPVSRQVNRSWWCMSLLQQVVLLQEVVGYSAVPLLAQTLVPPGDFSAGGGCAVLFFVDTWPWGMSPAWLSVTRNIKEKALCLQPGSLREGPEGRGRG